VGTLGFSLSDGVLRVPYTHLRVLGELKTFNHLLYALFGLLGGFSCTLLISSTILLLLSIMLIIECFLNYHGKLGFSKNATKITVGKH
jgi:hypothetical protein